VCVLGGFVSFSGEAFRHGMLLLSLPFNQPGWRPWLSRILIRFPGVSLCVSTASA